MKLSLGKISVIILMVPAALQAAAAALMFNYLFQLDANISNLEQMQAAAIKTHQLSEDLHNIRGELDKQYQRLNDKTVHAYRAGIERISVETQSLRQKLNNVQLLAKEVDEVGAKAKTTLANLDQLESLAGLGRHGISDLDAESFIRSAAELSDRLVKLSTRTAGCAQSLLAAQRQLVNSSLVCLAVLLALILLQAGTSISSFDAFIVRPLEKLLRTVKKHQDHALSQKPASSTEEISELTQTIETLLAKLDEASESVNAIFEDAKDVICVVDPMGTFQSVSPASKKIWGYDPSELIGRSYTDLLFESNETSMLESSRTQSSTNTSFSFESKVRRADGGLVDMLWSARWSAQKQSIICIAHDITRRKEAEEQLKQSESKVRTIIEQMPLGLVLTDTRGKILMTNQSLLKMIGRGRDEVVGQGLEIIFEESQTDERFKISRIAPEQKKPLELIALAADSVRIPVEVSIKRFNAIEEAGYLSVILDISERKALERLKQDFLLMVSHDLRTPITSILAFIELVARETFGPINDFGRKRARAATRNSTRLLTMISNLLDLERLETGGAMLTIEMTSLEMIVERAFDSVQETATENGISLEFASNGVDEIYVDVESIVQVLVNLLGNAIKFSPARTAITVSATYGDDCVEIRIIDRGRGIPTELQEVIFDRFRQVEIRDRLEKRGTGLGLAICRAIVKQHGGTINVQSTYGEGSTFLVRLPLSTHSRTQPDD